MACLLLVAFSAHGQPPNNPGSICGMALDENGAPASLVKIVARYVGPAAHTGPFPMGNTDKFGHYCVTNIAIGDYVMSADDPEKGYPIMESFFYIPYSLRPKISITAQSLEGHADWQIPYKAGFIRVQLTDERTGKQIIPMFYNLVVLSRPDVGYMAVALRQWLFLFLPTRTSISP